MNQIALCFVLGLSLSTPSKAADVKVCWRKAQILAGVINHYWLRTSRGDAGMGPKDLKPGDRLGDNRTDGLFTEVFVVDHSNDVPTECVPVEVKSESCVLDKIPIGRPLGKFHPFNTCYSFVLETLMACGASGENFNHLRGDDRGTDVAFMSSSCHDPVSCVEKMDAIDAMLVPASDPVNAAKVSDLTRNASRPNSSTTEQIASASASPFL